MRCFVLIPVLLSGIAIAEERPISFSWQHNYQQTNGTAIPSDDLVVTVYDEADSEICSGNVGCNTTQPYDTCVTYYAVATQLSTALQSVPSEEVESCTGPFPPTALTMPVLEIQLN